MIGPGQLDPTLGLTGVDLPALRWVTIVQHRGLWVNLGPASDSLRGRLRPLLADTKTAEDSAQDIFGGDPTGDLTQSVQRFADFQGQQLRDIDGLGRTID